MNRTTIEIKLKKDIDTTINILNSILMHHGYQNKIFKGENVWLKGDGFVGYMQIFSYNFTEDSLILQGWTRDAVLGESALEGFVGMVPKKKMKAVMDEIVNNISDISYGRNNSVNSDYSFRMNFDSPNINNSDEAGKDQWKCRCGKIHANYVGTCGCGLTKDEILSMEQEDKANSDQSQSEQVQLLEDVVKDVAKPKAEVKVTTESVKFDPGLYDKENSLLSKELESANYDLLKRVKNLYDEGIITQEEFETKKKQLLGL